MSGIVFLPIKGKIVPANNFEARSRFEANSQAEKFFTIHPYSPSHHVMDGS